MHRHRHTPPFSPRASKALSALLAVCVGTMGFGALVAVGGGWVFEMACMDQLRPTFWGASPRPPMAALEVDFAFRALGSLIAGMGAGVYMLADGPLRDGDCRAVGWIARMLILWFVLDLIAAIPGGAWSSVGLNVVFLMVYAVPLMVLSHELREPEDETGAHAIPPG